MKLTSYGIPYMGSKSGKIAALSRAFPKAEHFYDIFGGGFSVTHFMLQHRSNDYKYFHFNEIDSSVCGLIKDAIAGKYNYNIFKPAWISKENFFKKKDMDPYVRLCWSFGNNSRAYMFSHDVGQYKKSMHLAVVFGEFNELSSAVLKFNSWSPRLNTITKRRLYLRNKIEYYRKTKLPDSLLQFLSPKRLEQLEQLQRLEQLEQLQQLERLQRLERLQQLEQLERLTFTSLDYRLINIEKNSVIYCDPPYENTAKYIINFNTQEFLNWAHEQTEPIFISEYNIKDSRFVPILGKYTKSRLHVSRKQVVEKLYCQASFADKVKIS